MSFKKMTSEFSDILLTVMNKKNGGEVMDIVIEEIGYEVLKNHFFYERTLYNTFFSKIKNDDSCFEKYRRSVKFYFFWCKRPQIYSSLSPDFKLIIIFSIMEYLISDSGYKNLSDWLKNNLKNI